MNLKGRLNALERNSKNVAPRLGVIMVPRFWSREDRAAYISGELASFAGGSTGGVVIHPEKGSI
ncbi:hypothetical protein HLH36_19590 [Gluconacetobacter aggeris]|uniref:Uncharacterized protein n=1 Tax=Gluconacetobacter aggeris TaxID=1286186 RepID=A0A7W4IWS4_9PROT|nr:hypothetical protein [Gluconacetobacter aggeris]MBB2170500.1 hypothetical protein [Gluconacetobacter aggeris]